MARTISRSSRRAFDQGATAPEHEHVGAGAAAGIAWINAIGNLGGHFGPDLIGQIRTANNGNADAAL